jgi:hypothetical protein
MSTRRKQFKCPKCKEWVWGFVIGTGECADCFYGAVEELRLRRAAEETGHE